MKVALITDIHANREALEAVLAHARARDFEQIAFLGDFVGYGADPAWVLDTVAEHVQQGAWAVQGNHDAAVAQLNVESMVPEARAVVTWTRAQLTPEQIGFLAQLPLTQRDGPRLLVHANPWAPGQWDYVSGRSDAARSLMATDAQMVVCGHMHDPKLYHLTGTGKGGEFVPVDGVAIPLSAQRRWLVIPGSVGQPRDGNPAACYAMLDTNAASITYWRVPYDVETAAQKIIASGLPERFASRLYVGR